MEQHIFLRNKISHNNYNVTALLQAGNNFANYSVCTKWYQFGLAAVVSPRRSRIYVITSQTIICLSNISW